MIRQTEATWSLGAERPEHPLGTYYAALLQRVQGAAPRNGSSVGDSSSVGTGYCVGVTSCNRREGVSTVASNLAIAATRTASGPVLLLDANAAHASQAQRFGLRADRGMLELLAGTALESDVLQATETERLMLLGPGRSAEGPRDFRGLPERLDSWRQRFELIVVDLPIADELSPCVSLAALLDGVLLVVEAERTDRDAVRRAKVRLERNRAHLLGVVLNKGRL